MPDWLDISWKSVVTILSLFVMTRMLGKKQLSQLNYFHYIAGITIGSIAAFISTDLEANFLIGLYGMALWAFIPLLFEWFAMKSLRLRKWLDGTPTVLIEKGRILEDNLRKARLTADELIQELRVKGVYRLADVEFAVLETDGQFSLKKMPGKEPATLEDLGLKPQEGASGHSVVVILDGKLMEDNLKSTGFEPVWLHKQLAKRKVKMKDVFLAQLDRHGQLDIDLYDDKMSHHS
ncbi:DUF421 domain-containing protein [Paenibacillus thermoaerophilus]|uniref:DUF421 domain-containing protein n=1 Tax=Paenibacillus thermoaerophilus TaxID=1215385 RepID=A0ABW2V1M9_9BACL|nr:DUF421 domain-containing protein [Paenibacillus thermoaerophilus]